MKMPSICAHLYVSLLIITLAFHTNSSSPQSISTLCEQQNGSGSSSRGANGHHHISPEIGSQYTLCHSYEAIKRIHKQIDDDQDGWIEPYETAGFIQEDLKIDNTKDDEKRHEKLHVKTAHVTVDDLWSAWTRSAVHNWTTSDVEYWLINVVRLPQYVDNFRKFGFNGSHLPLSATHSSFLSSTLKIESAIHRSRITLKSMDIVLFGYAKEMDGGLSTKDVILTSLLLLSVTCFIWSNKQNQASKAIVRKMTLDLDSLHKAEQELRRLQEKLNGVDASCISSSDDTSTANHGGNRSSILVQEAKDREETLKGEIRRLQDELQRVEEHIQDINSDEFSNKSRVYPPTLQSFLQLTYELETQTFNVNKVNAENMFRNAREMCDKLKRKRGSIIGSFASVHDNSVDKVDRVIVEARGALIKITEELNERTYRWKQIEAELGFDIVRNLGLSAIKTSLAADHTSSSVNCVDCENGENPLRKSSTYELSDDGQCNMSSVAAQARWNRVRSSIKPMYYAKQFRQTVSASRYQNHVVAAATFYDTSNTTDKNDTEKILNAKQQTTSASDLERLARETRKLSHSLSSSCFNTISENDEKTSSLKTTTPFYSSESEATSSNTSLNKIPTIKSTSSKGTPPQQKDKSKKHKSFANKFLFPKTSFRCKDSKN